ncbi:hypothetical protein NW754_006978 [Fusarium falciforme]|nr:hypothetical protein NW754_006978 [Fusarium falciforme]
MFRQRTSSQKPGDELLANFRQQFPEVAAVSTSAAAPVISQTVGADNPLAPTAPPPERYVMVLEQLHEYPGPANKPRATFQLGTAFGLLSSVANLASYNRTQGIGQDAFRDQDPTPRATNDPWRFTPSLLDPNSMSFANFANAPPGYYTPTPGGTNTLFHPQAGDLHTPTLGLGMGLNTPLSMPTSGDGMQPGPSQAVMDMTGFQALQPHQFHHFNPFIQAPPPQPAFAPSTFVHQDTGYETMDQDGSPMDSDPSEERMSSIGTTLQKTTPLVGLQSHQFSSPMTHPLPPSAEKFRFHSTLNAPTAMIKHSDEIPVTYLNKGQAYSLSVADTNATMPVAPGTKYRTFVRVSFEDDQQRQRPGVCWGLWKEGRGTNEAHQRGGKLQAVDHSKGVKGIPVRLCAKTHPVPCDPSQPTADANPDICYCKVKLFRDHGAERKLSNDVAHVKKSIDKLKQQIAQAESGLKDFGKRKRSSGAAKMGDQRPGKVQKHKRTWSMSSSQLRWGRQ